MQKISVVASMPENEHHLFKPPWSYHPSNSSLSLQIKKTQFSLRRPVFLDLHIKCSRTCWPFPANPFSAASHPVLPSTSLFTNLQNPVLWHSHIRLCKAVPDKSMKAQRESRGIAPLILSLGARWRWAISITSRPLCSLERTLNQLNPGGPQSWSGLVQKKKISDCENPCRRILMYCLAFSMKKKKKVRKATKILGTFGRYCGQNSKLA